MGDTIRQYAKFIAALIGAFVTAFSTLIPAEWSPWVTAVAAFLTAVSVLAIPNAITEPQKVEVAKHLAEQGVPMPIAEYAIGVDGGIADNSRGE